MSSSMEKPLDLFSEAVDLSVLGEIGFWKGVLASTLLVNLFLALSAAVVWTLEEVEEEDDRLLEPCPQVALFSDLSAISSNCLGLISVWVSRCVLRLDLWLKHRWQMGHRWGDSSMWRILWTARVLDWQNPFPHSLHLKGFSLEWMYLWSLRWSCLLKALPQISQLKGLSSVWVLSWISRL